MVTEQVNLRLEEALLASIEAAAESESLDRSTMIRKLLIEALNEWRVDRAVRQLQDGTLSLGRAAEDAGLSQWMMLDILKDRRIGYPLSPEEVGSRSSEALNAFSKQEIRTGPRAGDTLPDIAPEVGGVLIVGINPAPKSVSAGHYYQGALGRRLWKRLERVGLLQNAVPGTEDRAFAAQGHGLTDLVKRPTRSAGELSIEELRDGVEALRIKIEQWRPSLVLFPFKKAARVVMDGDPVPGLGEELWGVPTFLLSGPYAATDITTAIDQELRSVLTGRHNLPQ